MLELCGSSELCEGLVVGQEGGFSLSTGPQSLTLRPQQQQGQDPLHWIEAIAAAITLARRYPPPPCLSSLYVLGQALLTLLLVLGWCAVAVAVERRG